MRYQPVVFVVYFVFALLVLATFSFAPFHPQRYYNFILSVPEHVEVYPGETVTITGNLTNTGMWRLRQFNLTLRDLTYEAIVEPSHLDEVAILRDWNPVQGVFRLPQNFNITIQVPANASGVHLVKVFGQEGWSWRQVSNSTEFILQVLSVPKISAAEFSAPLVVNVSEPFTAALSLANEGLTLTEANVSLEAPAEWKVEGAEQAVILPPNSTTKVNFTVTPTDLGGALVAKVSYQFRGNISTITQSSEQIMPVTPRVEPPKEEKKEVTGFAAVINFVKGLSPIVLGIIVLILVIILWNIYKVVRVLTKKKKKPEEAKKQVGLNEDLGITRL